MSEGDFAKKSEAAASNVTNTVSAGASSLVMRGRTRGEAKQIKAKSLRKFFLTLGFSVVLASADNTSVVALSLKVPTI